jgi:hypothetical protein
MPDPRQITELPVATEANDVDLLLMRQGLFDKQVEVDLIRAGLLRANNNLSEITDPAAARVNIGVDTSNFLSAGNNLSDLNDTATARANLGVDTSNFLVATNNLSDIGDTTAARNNLQVAATSADNNYGYNIQENMQLKTYSEVTVAGGNISGSYTLDLSAGNIYYATVVGNVSMAFSGAPMGGQTASVFLEIQNGGSFTVSWPSSVEWPGGSAPTLSSLGVDFIVFITRDGGATWRGILSGSDFS